MASRGVHAVLAVPTLAVPLHRSPFVKACESRIQAIWPTPREYTVQIRQVESSTGRLPVTYRIVFPNPIQYSNTVLVI